MDNRNIFFGLHQTLGDVIVSTSIIREIKRKYPDSKITYAVGKDYIEILDGNPDISEIIPINSHWEAILRSNEKPYWKIMLPLMKTTEDTLWHQRTPWCLEPKDGEFHNLVDMYAYKCGDDLKITDRRSFLFPKDQAWQEILSSPSQYINELKDNQFITIHTTSRNESKDWSFSNFAELAKRVYDRYEGKINIYQVGGAKDIPLPAPVRCTNGTNLKHTIALINKSKFHIDIDSGTSFIADSLNVPTVCIMGATWARTSGPIGPNVTFIEPERKCLDSVIHTPCHAHCVIKDKCIDTLTVDKVFEQIINKLDPILSKNEKTE